MGRTLAPGLGAQPGCVTSFCGLSGSLLTCSCPTEAGQCSTAPEAPGGSHVAVVPTQLGLCGNPDPHRLVTFHPTGDKSATVPPCYNARLAPGDRCLLPSKYAADPPRAHLPPATCPRPGPLPPHGAPIHTPALLSQQGLRRTYLNKTDPSIGSKASKTFLINGH